MTHPPAAPADDAVLERARRGDQEAFAALVEPHRRELQVHCYRMLGSPFDAEDLVQETFLRAWRRLDGFRGDGRFRAWLYRIATNACLDALERRPRRILPESYGPPTDRLPSGPPPAEVAWLGPYPDGWLEGVPDPGADAHVRFGQRESTQLAFVAAIQHLPPRQRAALLLRDVLGWRASEVALALETSATAVHSALQRARATLQRAFPEGRPEVLPDPTPEQRALLDRFIRAWEAGDLRALIAMLREDAILTMPPTPEWYRGRDAIADFLRWAWGPDGPGPFRLLPTTANRQPAFALYGPDRQGTAYAALAIQVLELDGVAIRSLTGFIDPELFPRFGLPPVIGG